MFYKVIKNNRVIDVLSSLTFVKYNKRHNTMFICNDVGKANGFLSSDRKYYWRTNSMAQCEKNIDTVELIKIDEYEYRQLKALTLMSPQEIIDAYTLSLINGGVL